jgi:hypothetical protein
MRAPFPARLHVLLASNAPVGVVLRRGPSRAVGSFLWDRKKDTFQTGQWMRARIYERRCDLSPDGRYMIYFAMNGRWGSKTRGSWTAISRAPWVKAITLYPKGDCWQGGGLFTSESRYWLNGCHEEATESARELQQDAKFCPPGGYGAECPGVYYVRLQRDGWILKDRLSAGITDQMSIFEKPLPKGWLLRKYAHSEVGAPPGRGCHWDEHELEQPAHQRRLTYPQWEWAERDGESLVWAEGGCLYRAALHAKSLGERRLLMDFNPLEFERLVAPY